MPENGRLVLWRQRQAAQNQADGGSRDGGSDDPSPGGDRSGGGYSMPAEEPVKALLGGHPPSIGASTGKLGAVAIGVSGITGLSSPDTVVRDDSAATLREVYTIPHRG